MQERKPSILFVDDEQVTRESISMFINRVSSENFICADGKEALETYKNNKIDIILSDINMPQMNGIELAKKIKEINPEQAIILVTAHNDSEHLLDAINLGVDGYIIKPIFVDKLFDKIMEVYEKISLKQKVIDQQKIIIQQEKMVSMGEMVGNIAHQWRQPLNALGSLITNLHIKYDSQTIDQAFYERFFEKSDFLIQKMSETIEDFSNFFKPDKSKQVFEIKSFINDSVKFFKETINDKNIDIKINVSNELEINNYKNELMQVIMNVLKNSYDAYTENEIQNKTIDIDLYLENDRVVISLQDYAGGIDESILDRVFEPYFTTKHKADGTGIGLYMCKMIIENSMNGFIKMENNKNGILTTISLSKQN